MTRKLRDYQVEAIAAVRAEWEAGRTRTAVVLATGLGKTDVIAALATDEAAGGGRTLTLAHRGELLDQIAERCGMHDPTLPVGRVQAGKDDYSNRITVAMAPTLASAKRRARLPRPSLLIADEGHHAASASWLKILDWAGCFALDGRAARARMLGVSATLVRGDKRKLGHVYQSVAYKRDIVWAVTHGPSRRDPLVTGKLGPGPDDAEFGWLVRPFGRVVVADHLDLDAAKKNSSGDYSEGDVGHMVEQDVDQIAEAWIEHARLPDGSHRITAAFMPTIAATQALADALNARGFKAEVVIGSTPEAERREIYKRLAAGVTNVLCGVMVTTEGWDCPEVSCILQGRPTKLPGLYTQIVGRGLRPSLASGKIDCLVLDVVGATRGQSLQTLVDLTPGARYMPAPCDACGGDRGAVESAGDAYALCTCGCPDCGRYTSRFRRRWMPEQCCDCPAPEPEEELAPAAKPAVAGRVARYETVDLLLSGSAFRWLTTKRFMIPFLMTDDRIGAVWPEGDLYIAGHGAVRGPDLDATALGPPAELDEARALVEDWAVSVQPNLRSQATAKRRKGLASEGLRKRAGRFGIGVDAGATTAWVNDAIDVARASSRLEPQT